MSDTPITDKACGWPVGYHGRIDSSDLKLSPDGPFVHSSVAREVERENAELNRKLDQILTNKDYEGGVQFWIKKHDAVLLREASLLAENAALREDKERLEWLERYHLSLSRLTSPDMSGLRFVGQCFNPAKERGEGGPSYLKIEGSTIRAAIDAARKEAQP